MVYKLDLYDQGKARTLLLFLDRCRLHFLVTPLGFRDKRNVNRAYLCKMQLRKHKKQCAEKGFTVLIYSWTVYGLKIGLTRSKSKLGFFHIQVSRVEQVPANVESEIINSFIYEYHAQSSKPLIGRTVVLELV